MSGKEIPRSKNMGRLKEKDLLGTALQRLKRIVRPLSKRELVFAFVMEHAYFARGGLSRGRSFVLRKAYANKSILQVSDPKVCFEDH